MHLRNPLNEGKPVKISRDGQEMDPAVGLQLACLFDEGYAQNPEQSLKRRKVRGRGRGRGRVRACLTLPSPNPT